MPESKRTTVPETHELIRDEDIEETLEHLADSSNPVLPQFGPEHLEWIRTALLERRGLAARQYKKDGRVDEAITHRMRELDEQIDSLSPLVLKVLHFLSRIRAIIPALLELQEEMKTPEPDPTKEMIRKMKFDCSRAEVQSAIQGLAELRIRPKILDTVQYRQS